MRTTRNRVYRQLYRGFESPYLRQYSQDYRIPLGNPAALRDFLCIDCGMGESFLGRKIRISIQCWFFDSQKLHILFSFAKLFL